MESLTCLGRLQKKGIQPFLVSFCGPNWKGSNEENNPDKFKYDREICHNLNLKAINIRTSFRVLIDNNNPAWQGRLKRGVNLMFAASLFSSLTYTFLIPIADQFKIKTLIAGSEKENNFGRSFYSFSADHTSRFKYLHARVNYKCYLNELWKVEIAKELYTQYSYLYKYQYSCLMNFKKRWCLNCEKCFRNFLMLKVFNIDPALVGLNEKAMKQNAARLILNLQWDIASNKVLRKEYIAIRKEATKSNSIEAKLLFKIIFRRYWLKRIYDRRTWLDF